MSVNEQENHTYCISVFIHTQRLMSSLVSERAWIGLSDIVSEGNLTWVDNSPLNQG